ncbi:MAG: signal peptidase II [Clostridiales bacterium]|nr:signal peptidase II [Candidatus Crickella merdequi]
MIPVYIAVGVIAIDQLTKILIRANFALGETLPVIGDFCRLTYVRNTGTAFSMFQNNHMVTIGLTTVLLVVCLLFMIIEWKRGSRAVSLSVTLVLAGGVSNLLDRLIMGYVTDMISIGRFAIFNFADMAVVTGCVFAAILIILASREEEDDEYRQ